MSMLRETSIEAYLSAVASASPTPGGGSVAAVVAALSSALGSMVAALSSPSEDPQLQKQATACAAAREQFLQQGAEDQEAFDAVMRALRLPKSDSTRTQLVTRSVQKAADVPLSVAQGCLDLLDVLQELAGMASRHAISDVGAACHFALAAMKASLLNVHINATFMKDVDMVHRYTTDAEKMASDGEARAQRITDHVLERIRG